MLSQANILPTTPMGANLMDGGGATFRLWAPLASAVYVNGTFGGTWQSGQTDDLLMAKDGMGTGRDSLLTRRKAILTITGSWAGIKRLQARSLRARMATDRRSPIAAA